MADRETPRIRVAVVEDNVRYREGLELLFSHAPGFALAASSGRAATLIADAERGAHDQWDLVLMDLQLPDLDGISAMRRLKAIAPGLPVVMLTVFEDPATILDAICAGADGYLLKKAPANELLHQLRALALGGAPLTASVARALLDVLRRQRPAEPGQAAAAASLDLSEREQDVLRGLVRGLTYQQVADAHRISLDTVRTHVRSIYQKLQVHSVAQAVSRAIRERLV